MNKIFLLALGITTLLCLSLYKEKPLSPEIAGVGVSVDVEAGDDYDEETQVIWIGPGWYYGVWFDNEYEYNDWHSRHYHHGHYHHGHYRREHHGRGHGGSHGKGDGKHHHGRSGKHHGGGRHK